MQHSKDSTNSRWRTKFKWFKSHLNSKSVTSGDRNHPHNSIIRIIFHSAKIQNKRRQETKYDSRLKFIDATHTHHFNVSISIIVLHSMQIVVRRINVSKQDAFIACVFPSVIPIPNLPSDFQFRLGFLSDSLLELLAFDVVFFLLIDQFSFRLFSRKLCILVKKKNVEFSKYSEDSDFRIF